MTICVCLDFSYLMFTMRSSGASGPFVLEGFLRELPSGIVSIAISPFHRARVTLLLIFLSVKKLTDEEHSTLLFISMIQWVCHYTGTRERKCHSPSMRE